MPATTIGELRASGYADRHVKDELRDNLLAKLSAGEPLFPGVLAAAACLFLSAAQRTLSTPVRRLRRAAVRVSGEVAFADGSTRPIDDAFLRHAPERALRTLSLALPILALGLVLFRLGWP